MRIDAVRAWYRETDHPIRFVLLRSLATFVPPSVLALLVWSLALALRQPDEVKTNTLAVIGTGLALLVVSIRALWLDLARFHRVREPMLGVIWKERGVYPLVEYAGTPRDVFAEYIMWNAGESAILVHQPSAVLTREFPTRDLGNARVELLRPHGAEWIPEAAFPILLSKGETAIWRHYTGEKAQIRPGMSETIKRDRDRAIRFIRDSEGDRKYVFGILHHAALPSDLRTRDLRRIYVGFSYNSSECINEPEVSEEHE